MCDCQSEKKRKKQKSAIKLFEGTGKLLQILWIKKIFKLSEQFWNILGPFTPSIICMISQELSNMFVRKAESICSQASLKPPLRWSFDLVREVLLKKILIFSVFEANLSCLTCNRISIGTNRCNSELETSARHIRQILPWAVSKQLNIGILVSTSALRSTSKIIEIFQNMLLKTTGENR